MMRSVAMMKPTADDDTDDNAVDSSDLNFGVAAMR